MGRKARRKKVAQVARLEQAPVGPRSPRGPVMLAAGGLLVLIAVVFAPLRHAGFISLDDPQYVTNNLRVASGLTWDGVKWALTATYAANWHPLTWMSHMLDVELFGVSAGPHHLVNILLHGMSALVLFAFLL